MIPTSTYKNSIQIGTNIHSKIEFYFRMSFEKNNCKNFDNLPNILVQISREDRILCTNIIQNHSSTLNMNTYEKFNNYWGYNEEGLLF